MIDRYSGGSAALPGAKFQSRESSSMYYVHLTVGERDPFLVNLAVVFTDAAY